MRRTLDHALADIRSSIKGLRAVVLSAAPDGLIAWCWSSDGRPDVALGFAALDRAATLCLDGLGDSLQARNLLLAANNAWVAAWPLFEPAARGPREHLVITTVFTGELQDGMVLVYGNRIRVHLREALVGVRSGELGELRRELVDTLEASDDPATRLRELAGGAGLESTSLARPEQLAGTDRQRLRELARR